MGDRGERMDFKGQQLAENIYYWLNIVFGIIGWIIGYIHEDFGFVFMAVGVAQAICLVVMIPDWPFFNKNPIQWQPCTQQPAAQPVMDPKLYQCRQKARS